MNDSKPAIRRSCALLALLLTLFSGAATAREMPDLYTEEVAWDSARRNARSMAYETALRAVLQRMTPEAAVLDIGTVFGRPGDYVLGWREGGPGRLWVSFDGVALTERLRAAGVPVWGSDRPLTLVWLALDNNDGTRSLVSAEAAATAIDVDVVAPLAPQPPGADPVAAFRDRLRAASSRYGVPASFPVLDDVDRAKVTDSDVWGGFDEVLLEASRRYGTSSVLIGKGNVSRPDAVRWTWLFAGDAQQFAGSFDTALRRVSTSMMQALASSPELSADVRISVVGIDGAAGLGQIVRLLRSQSLIDRVGVLGMHADEVLFEVDSLTSRERLATMLDGDLLILVEPPLAGVTGFGADLHFRVQPR